jgi:hypothetical protein
VDARRYATVLSDETAGSALRADSVYGAS